MTTTQVTQMTYLKNGRLRFTVGSLTIEIEAFDGQIINVKDGELGSQEYVIRQDQLQQLQQFAKDVYEDTEGEDEEPMVSDVKVPNEFEVIVNVGNGFRMNVLRDIQPSDMDEELWAYMAHNLLRFATNKMGQTVNAGQANQSPAQIQGLQPGVLPFPPVGPR